MKVRFDHGILNADDYGDVHIYESHYHGEVKLGSIDEDGNFEPAYWLESSTDFLDSLRETMRRQYFGESKNYDDREQNAWPEKYIQFMKLDELPAIGEEWRPLWEAKKDPVTAKLRYHREDASPLHGIYFNAEKQLLQVIHQGRLLKAFELLLPLSEEDLSQTDWINLLCDPQLGWQDTSEPFSSLTEGTFKQCSEGKMNFGVIYCHSISTMNELAEKAEKAGLKINVFKHQQEQRHFRMVIFKADALEIIPHTLPDLTLKEPQHRDKFENLKASFNAETFSKDLDTLSPFQNIEQPKSELDLLFKYHLLSLPFNFCLSAALNVESN